MRPITERLSVILFFSILSIMAGCGESDAPGNKSSPAVTETAPASIPSQEQTQVSPPEPVVAESVAPEEPAQEAVKVADAEIATPIAPAPEIIQKVVEPVAEPEPPMVEAAAPAEQVTETPAAPQQQPVGAAKSHTINAEARVFNPDIIYVQTGDTVNWINMTSHNTVSVEGLIPEGATHWRGSLGENLKVTLEKEGVYAYVCEPHIGFGMVGVIVAGKPANLEEVKAYADKNLQGPYRRLIGKLNKVTIQ